MTETAGLTAQAGRAALWVALDKWGTRVSSLVVFAVLARLLAPTDFGLLALAMVVTSFLTIFVDQGFSTALVQRKELTEAHRSTAFWSVVGIAAVLAAAGAAAAPLAAGLLDEPRLTPVLRLACLVLFIGSLSSTQAALLHRALAFKVMTKRNLVASLAGGVAGVAMAAAGFGVYALIGQLLTYSTVGGIVLWRATAWRPRWMFDRRAFADLYSFGVNMLGLALIGFVTEQSDKFLIGAVLGPQALGYYMIAYRLFALLLDLFTSVVSQVSLSAFSRLQDDMPAMRRALLGGTRLTGALGVPVFVALMVLAPLIIPAAFGDGWGPSVRVSQVIAGVGLIYSVSFFDRAFLLAMGRPRVELGITLIATVANVVAVLVSVRYGILAVAIALLVRNYLTWPVRLLALKRVGGVDMTRYLRQWAAPLPAGAAAGLVWFGMLQLVGDREGLLVTCAALAPGLAVYAVLLRLTAPGAALALTRTVRSVTRRVPAAA